MKFDTIQQFKDRAEFFPAGRIIPQRILKGPRRYKHLVRFASDTWALCTPGGYVLALDSTPARPVAIRVLGVVNSTRMRLTVRCSPYCPSPRPRTWFAWIVEGDASQLNLINNVVAKGA